MKSYKALAPVALFPGTVVHLTTAQARIRAHALEKQGKGNTFLVTSRIEFKAGESFKVDGDLPKNLAELVEPEEAQTAVPPAPPAPSPAPAPPAA
ncbi:hypothetical protein [Variovorax sp. V15]|uniref:hypothetical protein n=1 Tax=Variovorax sp. V15 TaxID=3065952 RepID=UPI0034E8C09A